MAESTTSETQIQQALFHMIKMSLPAHLSLAEEIAELLNVSTDSAYRRIRGEKPLTLPEVALICQKFSISLDSLLSIQSKSVVFFGSIIKPEELTFENYLKNMLRNIQAINQFKERRIIYFAKDIPIFYHFNFKELSHFKFYFWMRTILQVPEYINKAFTLEMKLSELDYMARQILEIYNNIPSTEIWNRETVNSTIKQMEYCQDAGLFDNQDDLKMLYDQLEELTDHVELQAETGKKFLVGKEVSEGDGNYEMYNNEVVLGDNTILVTMDEVKTTFLIHNVLNYLTTSDDRFCEYTMQNLKNIMKRSSLISSVNEKDRHRFFMNIREKIEKSRKKHLSAS